MKSSREYLDGLATVKHNNVGMRTDKHNAHSIYTQLVRREKSKQDIISYTAAHLS